MPKIIKIELGLTKLLQKNGASFFDSHGTELTWVAGVRIAW